MSRYSALVWPLTPRAIATHRPTPDQWAAEVALGWYSDGSSYSTDTIEGVRIGITGKAYRPDLPANLHDFRYRVIRRLVAARLIDDARRLAMRAAADWDHWQGLRDATKHLEGVAGLRARARCAVRYYAIRWTGAKYTRPQSFEVYPHVDRDELVAEA